MSTPVTTTNRYVVMHQSRPVGHSSSFIRARKMAEVNYRHIHPNSDGDEFVWSNTGKLFDHNSFTGWEVLNVPPIGPGGGVE